MKKFFQISGCLLAFGLYSSSAMAGLYVEPYLGYVISGDSEIKVAGSSISDGDLTGASYGLRAGWSLPVMFAFGLEYQGGTLTYEVSGSADEDYDFSAVGLFASAKFIFVKAYATYFFDATIEDESNTEYSGSGYKIGVGYTGLPFIAINLDYSVFNYDEASPSISGVDVDSTMTMLSVSVPFDI
ncbi:MAG: hypothetical protein KDD37_05490 [Bdellovibrionales bacterium]|nr:hypothetical protein [Bdellovibrionales bacterium]